MNPQLVDITDSVTQAIHYLSYAVLFLCVLMLVGVSYLHSILKRLPPKTNAGQSSTEL